MTATTYPVGLRRRRRVGARAGVVLPPISPRLALVRAVLVLIAVLSGTLVIELLVVSSVQQRAAQQRAYDRFRGELARGTAPVGPTDATGRELAPGTPVAYIEIPSIGVRQVVLEGTAAGTLFAGPGHRRDTPLPGQPGVSVVLGRKSAFGGPFAHIHELRPGARIHVTTGQGSFDYRVIGVRREGEPVPAPARADTGRLLLVTAAGRPFMPSGVLRVDAELTGPPAAGVARLVSGASLTAPEQIMSADPTTLWALALWLQALVLVVLLALWAWHRWGPPQAWIVMLPPVLVVGLATSGEGARLLPNLL